MTSARKISELDPGRWADGAFAGTVVCAYVGGFIARPDLLAPATLLPLLALGGLYVGLALKALDWCQSRGWLHLYFTVQVVLVCLIAVVGGGNFWLVPLPLVSHAVFCLSRRGVALICLIAWAIFLVSLGWPDNWWTAGFNAFFYLPALFFVVLFTYVAVRERQTRNEASQLAEALQTANRQLREYAAQAEELATVKERNRLAREIHDTLGHYLTVINVQLEAAQALQKSEPARAAEAMAKAQALSKEGLAEVRRSVATLRAAPVEDRPLPEALAALVEACQAAGLVAQLRLTGAPRPLPPPATQALYRAAQEALTNVRKHARASKVELTLDYTPAGRVQLVVQDNGVGAAQTEGGFGLLGVRERAHLLGGEARWRTAPGAGFTLEIDLPG